MIRLSRLCVLLFTTVFLSPPLSAEGSGFDGEIFERWVTARAGTGEPVYWYSEGDVKTYPGGKVLARMEGFDAARLYWPDRTSDKAYQFSRKIYIFRDAETGEILETFNGNPIPAVKFPYQHMTYTRDGDKLVSWIEQGVGESYLKIGPVTDIKARRLGRTIVYTAPLFLDVDGPATIRRTLFENYDFFIQPDTDDPREQYQLSWLRYGERSGFSDGPTVTHMVSWRVDRFEDLPERMQTYVRDEAPLWLEPPRDLAEIRQLQEPAGD